MADRRRFYSLAALALVLGLYVAVQATYFGRGFIPGDAFTYLAAGERLNAGHLLYALSPGDRPVDLNPPYWTVPLLSPPPIAVVFRPFAALPPDTGAYAWWALQLVALAISLVMLGRRKPLLTAGAMLLLLIPTVYEIGVGNLNSMVLLGLILTWRWATRGPEPAAGVVAALLTVVKLTPAALGWWLIVTRKWRAVAAAVVTGIVALAISVLGAGLDTHLEYLRILRDPASMSPSALSLAGMAAYVGVPTGIANLLPTAAIAIGLVTIFLLRNRPAWAFGATVLVMIYGSPAVSINWYVLLYALIAPLAWPIPAEESVLADAAPDGVPSPLTS
jgi:alpha-1,2-mannosyltransferase